MMADKYGKDYKYESFDEQKVLIDDSYHYLVRVVFNIDTAKIMHENKLNELQQKIVEIKNNIALCKSDMLYYKTAMFNYEKELKIITKQFEELIKEGV